MTVWWVDRCLGAHLLPTALRERGLTIRTHADLYGSRDSVPDAEWILDVAKRGWVILTKDQAILRTPVEIEALRTARAKYVCLSAKGLSGPQQAECFAAHWKTIEGVVAARKAPLILAVNRTGVREFKARENAWREVKPKR